MITVIDNTEAGHQFMTRAMLAASEAARSAPRSKEGIMREVDAHIDCARAHYAAAFEEAEAALKTEQNETVPT